MGYSPWITKESDTTEGLNSKQHIYVYPHISIEIAQRGKFVKISRYLKRRQHNDRRRYIGAVKHVHVYFDVIQMVKNLPVIQETWVLFPGLG